MGRKGSLTSLKMRRQTMERNPLKLTANPSSLRGIRVPPGTEDKKMHLGGCLLTCNPSLESLKYYCKKGEVDGESRRGMSGVRLLWVLRGRLRGAESKGTRSGSWKWEEER